MCLPILASPVSIAYLLCARIARNTEEGQRKREPHALAVFLCVIVKILSSRFRCEALLSCVASVGAKPSDNNDEFFQPAAFRSEDLQHCSLRMTCTSISIYAGQGAGKHVNEPFDVTK